MYNECTPEVRFNFTLAWAIVRRPITGERSERFIDQSQASEASGQLQASEASHKRAKRAFGGFC